MQLHLLRKNQKAFSCWAYEHLGISVHTGNQGTYNPRDDNNTTILDHLHQSKICHGKLDDFDIIGKAGDFFLHVKESLLIKKFKSKRQKYSVTSF